MTQKAQTTKTISVYECKTPIVNFSADKTHGYDQLEVEFVSKAEAGTGNIESWEWDFGDLETGSGREVTHNYDSAGDYDVKLTVMNECGAIGEKKERDYIKIEGNKAEQLEVSGPIQIKSGETETFKAVATFLDGTKEDVTESCIFSVSNPEYAAFDIYNKGRLTAKSVTNDQIITVSVSYPSQNISDDYSVKIIADEIEPPPTDCHHSLVWSGNPFEPMNIYVIRLNNMSIEKGDEIYVMDGDKRVGCSVVQNEISIQSPLRIITSKADNGDDGFTKNNPIQYELWDKSEAKMIDSDMINASYFNTNETPDPISTPVFKSLENYAVQLDIADEITQTIELKKVGIFFHPMSAQKKKYETTVSIIN
ncbi:MAG: hypothetical protein OMM_05535 [Candidatus Magnetoglobus multicellularis str. Araruama]|uniref:PKD domain-containing protein n=1 Tax=Candidatus Magnetoglobus multicellularis str. Araruama TaxID=890399 RepID=A0A1V1NVV2_9BACT|nr:MAG: hypothetical protein OMM_05535 [Candidatus Magnetoglobus multicellularis str. Araruama]